METRDKLFIYSSQITSFITIIISVYLLFTNTGRTSIRTILLVIWTAFFVLDTFTIIKRHIQNDKESKMNKLDFIKNMSQKNYIFSLLNSTAIKLIVPFLING